MPTREPARPYDRWGDADGVHIPDQCRVEQIGVAKEHGALACRLTKCGEVVGRGTNRINVKFDGESNVVSVRPHLVRVVVRPHLVAPRPVTP